ncbi:MAG: sporulation protein YqfD [Defluviitaleaceae bacterium]|nr:sporulation protein YqfD [Defluviitaleaceae bacterium]
MMLNMWQYAKGYVRIRVTGFSIERFLNMAAYRGIYLWDVERAPEGVHANVSIKGFKSLRVCSRKTKCRTKIIEKNGLPFMAHRYRKRKLLLGGILFFVLMMVVLSSFIWRVEIVGGDGVCHETILTFLDEQGLHIGVFKHTIDARGLTRELLNHFDELSWADINTRGTRTTIMIAEAIPQQPIIDRQTPTHVVAAHDGLITRIATSSGAPMVRQNDVVRQGEMLVSGFLELGVDTGNPQTAYVHAYAEVWARRYHPIEFIVPFTYIDKVYTGRSTTRHSLQFLFAGNFRLNIPRGGISFDSYDRITTHHQLGVGGDYPMPFILAMDRYLEFIPTRRTRSIEEATLLAESMLGNRIMREFDFGIDIIDRQVEMEETSEALVVRALIITHQRIDMQVPID